MSPRKIMIVTGEVSGDLHGAHLVEALQRLDPEIDFFGVGGDRLQGRGMRLLEHIHSLSVVGISEAFRKLGTALRTLKTLKKALDQERPDLVILIDYPEFNLRLARIAHRKGIPVLYYISPQIWAWRAGRVRSIARWVRKMVVFFPFEVPLYRAAGVDVDWVGHPLLDLVKVSLSREEAFKKFNLNPNHKTLGLLPGSRIEEVRRHLPVMVSAAHLLRKEIPEVQFILPRAPGIPQGDLLHYLRRASFPISVAEEFHYDAMAISDLLITASGTATLEAAILRKPMVILYKVSRISYWIGRALIRVKHIGLVNLVAEKEIARELIQDEANPERIAEESLRLLKDPDLYARTVQSLQGVREALGEPGAADRAARIVHALLHKNEV